MPAAPVLSETVRRETWRNGHLFARLGQPVSVCPFAAQRDSRERVLARIWVSGYMAAAPPPPEGVVDLGTAEPGLPLAGEGAA